MKGEWLYVRGLKLESQHWELKAVKQAKAEARKKAATSDIARTMKPRRNDGSQLLDEISKVGPSQYLDCRSRMYDSPTRRDLS